jgi:23S rRNA pseudouridine1911/1915/1917 synthase
MQARAVQKEYLALIYGHPTVDAGVIEAPIGRDRSDRQKMGVVPEGREARTSFQVIERLVGYSLLRLKLDTGRTHQIRVHLSAIGHPVVGDVVYGPRPPTLGLTRPFLHSWHLGFELPDGNACVTVWSPLRPDLTAVLQVLREKG